MKVVFINCPRCGKAFCVEVLLTQNRLPLHCPGCDAFLAPAEYGPQLVSLVTTAVARIRRPLNENTAGEIIYIPATEAKQ